MSGADDRGPETPGKNPLFDELDIVPSARPRRKAKPPPNIITAGGVDMARGHASGIQPRGGGSPAPPVDEPRVVISIETDPRKVPTHRRLAEIRDAGDEGPRAALLPGSSQVTPVSTDRARIPESSAPGNEDTRIPRAARGSAGQSPAGAPSPGGERALPTWMRIAFAAVLLLSLAGVAQRFRGSPVAKVAPGEPVGPLVPVELVAEPPAPPPPATVALDTAPFSPAPAAAPPPVTTAPTAGAEPAPVTTGEPQRSPRAHAPVASPSPRNTPFTPPFQLPSEKN